MNQFYTTMSLNVAAYLKGNGMNVLKVEKVNNKAVFYFEKNQQVKMLVDMYLNDSALKRFITAFKEVKGLALKNQNK